MVVKLNPIHIHKNIEDTEQIFKNKVPYIQPLFIEIHVLRTNVLNRNPLTEIQIRKLDNIISLLQKNGSDVDMNGFYNIGEFEPIDSIACINVSGKYGGDVSLELQGVLSLKAICQIDSTMLH